MVAEKPFQGQCVSVMSVPAECMLLAGFCRQELSCMRGPFQHAVVEFNLRVQALYKLIYQHARLTNQFSDIESPLSWWVGFFLADIFYYVPSSTHPPFIDASTTQGHPSNL